MCNCHIEPSTVPVRHPDCDTPTSLCAAPFISFCPSLNHTTGTSTLCYLSPIQSYTSLHNAITTQSIPHVTSFFSQIQCNCSTIAFSQVKYSILLLACTRSSTCSKTVISFPCFNLFACLHAWMDMMHTATFKGRISCTFIFALFQQGPCHLVSLCGKNSNTIWASMPTFSFRVSCESELFITKLYEEKNRADY